MKNVNSKKVIELLNKKCSGARCPLCGGVKWNVIDKCYELREFNDGNFVIGGANASIIPVIPLTCANCGNTIFINALVNDLLGE